MRTDIETALARLGGGQQAAFKVPGRLKKALKALDGTAGSSNVVGLAVVWDPPAGVRERLAMGTAGGLHQGWKDVTHNFLGVVTDSEVLEIRAGSGMLSGPPKVQRLALRQIREVITDSPRMARSVGAKIPLIVVDGGSTGGFVWKLAKDDQRDAFANQIRRALKS
jgi:hypothetical protein